MFMRHVTEKFSDNSNSVQVLTTDLTRSVGAVGDEDHPLQGWAT